MHVYKNFDGASVCTINQEIFIVKELIGGKHENFMHEINHQQECKKRSCKLVRPPNT